ncbi:UvsX-like recombinase [Bacillus phage Shbh1]|uniref:Recombinase A-like protein n=1 Tax=Bacillus phage Shbh1 TaxID=1796992 RepID=A0A142F1I8_9CAUD|nr:UvsX-like recombinase [Bacillus phage Shbh1]AMQ66645.1 recombinase A-like protein [Bacillus phage Shbh1]
MAKKKTNKKVDIDLSSLAQDAGLTILQDSTFATIYDRLPLFLPRIDKIFGGGLPFGRMVEVAGSPGGGKSTIAFHAARVATELGCIVVLIDVEGTADKLRLAHLGIDVSKVMVKQPDPESGIKLTVEEVGRTVESCLDIFPEKYPGVPVVFIWDSVGQTPSIDELEKDFGDKNVGLRAKAISQFIYKTASRISETKSLLIGINQVRADIGGNPMFPQLHVPGGSAWEHYASLRLEIRQGTQVKKGNDKIGHVMKVILRKSKVSRPHQTAEGWLISDNGIDYEYNLVHMGVDAGIVSGKGQSFEYIDNNGEVHKQKRENFIEWLRGEGKQVRAEILNKLIELEFPQGYPPLSNENLDISGWIDPLYSNISPSIEEVKEAKDE